MALYDELIDQADHLLTGPLGPGGVPSEADIRRAISNAYYAVFHLLVITATDLLCPPHLPPLQRRFRRGFAHAGMKTVCLAVAIGDPSRMPEVLRTLFPQRLDPSLVTVAAAFARLQTDRYLADYDSSHVMTLEAAQEAIDTARRAIAAWQTIQDSDDAKVFLTALPMHGNWQRT